MPNVLLVGAFGQGNPGDEALCAAFLRAMSDDDVVVASSDPAATAAQHGVRAIADQPLTVARQLRWCDAVVVGGGTVFKTLRPSTGRRPTALLRNACALTAAAKSAGKHVALIGVGAGDLRGRQPRLLARWLVRHADLLVLRDEESAAALTEIGSPTPFWIGADPAWSLRRPHLDNFGNTPERRRSVTVALSHHAGGDRLFDNLVAAIGPLGATHELRVQPWQTGPGGDLEIAERLGDHLGGHVKVLDPPTDLDAAIATFADDQLVVALRFHALVAAGQAGTRSIAISHEPKLAGLSRRLRQTSVPVDSTADVLAAALRRALDGDAPNAVDVAREVAASGHALQLLRLLLDGGDLDEPNRLVGLPLSSGGGTW